MSHQELVETLCPNQRCAVGCAMADGGLTSPSQLGWSAGLSRILKHPLCWTYEHHVRCLRSLQWVKGARYGQASSRGRNLRSCLWWACREQCCRVVCLMVPCMVCKASAGTLAVSTTLTGPLPQLVAAADISAVELQKSEVWQHNGQSLQLSTC